MRWSIRAHVAAFLISAAFTFVDLGMLRSPAASEVAFNVLGFLLLPALAAIFLCPMITLALSTRKSVSRNELEVALLAEALLVVGQVLVFLPTVS
jgi:hypothetical protein